MSKKLFRHFPFKIFLFQHFSLQYTSCFFVLSILHRYIDTYPGDVMLETSEMKARILRNRIRNTLGLVCFRLKV